MQHGAGTDAPGFLMYPRHGYNVDNTWPHERSALAKGMPKTKHITAKQVTLKSIELAMIDLEEEILHVKCVECRGECLCYGGT